MRPAIEVSSGPIGVAEPLSIEAVATATQLETSAGKVTVRATVFVLLSVDCCETDTPPLDLTTLPLMSSSTNSLVAGAPGWPFVPGEPCDPRAPAAPAGPTLAQDTARSCRLHDLARRSAPVRFAAHAWMASVLVAATAYPPAPANTVIAATARYPSQCICPSRDGCLRKLERFAAARLRARSAERGASRASAPSGAGRPRESAGRVRRPRRARAVRWRRDRRGRARR